MEKQSKLPSLAVRTGHESVNDDDVAAGHTIADTTQAQATTASPKCLALAAAAPRQKSMMLVRWLQDEGSGPPTTEKLVRKPGPKT
ncbi:uncharacterized protein MAM_06547 [Metarhizium album ARSEF 1941]|uniref:Uncharacterized protein n=1 Tax=Metarhizium album (strain ARSEF 1941) TaxID=1081103 RepID=A0A0B2WR87_METAS|nr:uncharacterized protein MAM_06547 [Metarhizium album ARSEF 1941]KHN95490.1 hypothetical protein MAM_06547 [Metarhizium album ARSEF 1941]